MHEDDPMLEHFAQLIFGMKFDKLGTYMSNGNNQRLEVVRLAIEFRQMKAVEKLSGMMKL